MENYNYNSYPDSGDSSPRSREIEFENPPPWEDQQQQGSQNYKVKFMCSYGGKILPRPHDNQLCYVGGETKILAVDRTTKFAALMSKLSSLCDGNDVLFKYQLPGEDLDALISVTNDDDLDNMMHEYDRLYRGSARPARMRLFLFAVNPRDSFGSDSGRSDRDRFVEALNSGLDPNSKPPVQNNVDFLFGLEKGIGGGVGVPAAVSPPPPPVPTAPEHVAPPQEFQVRSGTSDRVLGSDPVVSAVEFRRQLQDLQRLQIGDQPDHQQQAMYRRSDENLVSGYGAAGDYYGQKMQEKASQMTAPPPVSAPAGYWPEKQVPSMGYPGTVTATHGTPEQPMYMIPAGGGAMYHAPPMVRSVTGPAGQGYYHVQQQRMPSDVYREQPMYNVVPQQQQQQQPPQSNLPPQPPKYVAAYTEGRGVGVVGAAETPSYAQVAYDSAMGRQVYYTAPGGVLAPQQQAYSAVSPPAAAVGGEMRVAGGLSQEGKVVGPKVPQASV